MNNVGAISDTNNSGKIKILKKTCRHQNQHILYKIIFLNTGTIKYVPLHRIKSKKIKDDYRFLNQQHVNLEGYYFLVTKEDLENDVICIKFENGYEITRVLHSCSLYTLKHIRMRRKIKILNKEKSKSVVGYSFQKLADVIDGNRQGVESLIKGRLSYYKGYTYVKDDGGND